MVYGGVSVLQILISEKQSKSKDGAVIPLPKGSRQLFVVVHIQNV